MTLFDWLVIIVLALSVLIGLWRGAAYEVLSLLGWPVAFLLSKYISPIISQYLPGNNEAVRTVLVYGVVFVVSLFLWGMLSGLFSKLITAIGMGIFDGLLGCIFGFLRGGILLLFIVMLAGLTSIPAQDFWREARWSESFEAVAIKAKIFLPDNIAQRIHYPVRK